MSFLRRALGGGSKAGSGPKPASPTAPVGHAPTTPEQDELARDRELAREDALRMADDLRARQLRYAERSWTPPSQGGSRRADDQTAVDPDGS